MEACKGITHDIEINRVEPCDECGGTGAKKGTQAKTCPDCHGTGKVNVRQQTMFGMMQSTRACSKCMGKGKIIDSPCPKCSGNGVFQKKVTVLGLAFKPDSDDVRDSPALDVAVQLNGRGAHVIATDPEAIPNSIRLQPQLGFATDTADALHGSDCVVLVTEWQEYRDLDPVALKELVRTPLIIDGRNVLDPEQWRAAGWTYRGMGRP